jgi:hypothetical protein
MSNQATKLATVLLERLGHKPSAWTVTSLGFDITTCTVCDAPFLVDSRGTKIILSTTGLMSISGWEKTYTFKPEDVTYFIRQVARRFPWAFCLKFQVMV